MPRSLYVYLVLLSLIWGGSFYFIKILLQYYEPGTISFLRAGFGLVTIGLIMLIFRKSMNLRQIPWGMMIIVGLFQMTIPWFLIGFSETRLTSSMASVLNATTPLWTLILGISFFYTKTHRNHWVGMILVFCGLIVLLGINPASLISVDLMGFTAMLMATFCYGISTQLSKRYLQELSLFQVVLGTLLVGCIGSGVVALSFESIPLTPLMTDGSVIISLLVLGCLGSGLGYILFYQMVQKGSAEFASWVTYLIPVTAIMWGALFLHETIHWTLLTGLLLILAGVFLSDRKPRTTSKISEKPLHDSSLPARNHTSSNL